MTQDGLKLTNLKAAVAALDAQEEKMRTKAPSKVAMCRRMSARIRDTAMNSHDLAQAAAWDAKALAWKSFAEGGPAPLGRWARAA